MTERNFTFNQIFDAEEMRMDPLNVLIAMTASRGPAAWAIRKLTRSPYNHVMVLYKCPFWGGWWSLQVDAHGVRPVPIETLTADVIRWKFFRYSTDLLPEIPRAKTDMNRDYDYLGIFGFLLKILTLQFTGLNVKNVIHRKKDVFCSEFTARFFKRINISGAYALDPPSVSPGDLVSFCSEGHGFTENSIRIFDLCFR